MKKITLLPIICLMLCLTAACAEHTKIYTNINEFATFSEMTQDGTDSISVKFDHDDGDYYEFIIEDENNIEEIMSIIFSLKFSEGSTHPIPPGNNTRIIINQGENRFSLSVRYIAQDNMYYYFGSALQSKIYDLAIEFGVNQ